jgi:hypothetical protein
MILTKKIHTKNSRQKRLVKMVGQNGYTPELVDTPKQIPFGL